MQNQAPTSNLHGSVIAERFASRDMSRCGSRRGHPHFGVTPLGCIRRVRLVLHDLLNVVKRYDDPPTLFAVVAFRFNAILAASGHAPSTRRTHSATPSIHGTW